MCGHSFKLEETTFDFWLRSNVIVLSTDRFRQEIARNREQFGKYAMETWSILHGQMDMTFGNEA